MELALKYGMWKLLRHTGIPVYFKQNIFFNYHVLTTSFLVLKTCALHVFNVSLPLDLCSAHLSSKNLNFLK